MATKSNYGNDKSKLKFDNMNRLKGPKTGNTTTTNKQSQKTTTKK